ncbi:MAG: exodeoxyribonuclease VII small subunit [Planctomycetota bacterium]
MPETPKDHEVESMSYEDAVGELEAIIDRIESGEVGLEDSITAYERGMALVKRCRGVLDQAEQRIETLEASRLADGGAEGGSA